MDWLQTFAHEAGRWAGLLCVALLCAGGVLLSTITLSGTWLVLLAAILLHALSGHPGWVVIGLSAGLCVLIEVLETLASSWGVQRRGGSYWAGLAALAGGIAGLFLGSFIPIPVLGNLIGMMIGSFAAAYAVERNRLKRHDHALHVAWGTVTARVLMLFLKVGATLGMILWLALG